jgi:hypothetical protein
MMQLHFFCLSLSDFLKEKIKPSCRFQFWCRFPCPTPSVLAKHGKYFDDPLSINVQVAGYRERFTCSQSSRPKTNFERNNYSLKSTELASVQESLLTTRPEQTKLMALIGLHTDFFFF